MSLYHFHVGQIEHSAGQSAVACAAYRAGEKLYSDYYGEVSDYTYKGGVICSEILLPSHAPPEYSDRQTLWNSVENAERHPKAQLAYSFDIALQNEFSLVENIALARQFLLEHFVSLGMICDFVVHHTDKGNLNRWIRATNSLLRKIKDRIAELTRWLKDNDTKLLTSEENLQSQLCLENIIPIATQKDILLSYAKEYRFPNLKFFVDAPCIIGTNQSSRKEQRFVPTLHIGGIEHGNKEKANHRKDNLCTDKRAT